MNTKQARFLAHYIFISLLLCFALQVWAQQTETPVSAADREAAMKAYYDSRTDWPRSCGFKPYMRHEWDIHQRAFPNGEIPAGALWEAYLERGRMPHAALDETWTPLGPFNHGGRTRVIRFHPDDPTIMFAGSVGGGLFKSIDSGNNWFPITDALPNLAIGSFEIHPLDPDIMFLGTGEGYFNADGIGGVGLFKSTDGGQTWNLTGLNYEYDAQNTAILTIDLDPRDTDILLASTGSGLRRSTDGGATWTMVRTGNVNSLERDPQNPDVLLCSAAYPFGAEGGNVYRSTDNGITWAFSGTGLPASNQIGRMVLAFYPGNSQIVWAGISGTSGYNGCEMIGVFRSTDNGLNWVQMSADGESHYASQGWYDMAIAVKPNNPNIVYSSGLDLYRSWNSGLWWDQQTYWYLEFGNPDFVHADHHEIVFHPNNPNEVWAVTDGGIFQSTDEGANWTEKNQGYNTYQYYAMGNATLDTSLAYGGTQDNGTSEYSGGPDWPMVFGGDGGYCVVDYTDNNTVYVEYQNGNRFRTDDGCANFTSINEGITGSGAWVTPMLLDPFVHNTIYTTTSNGHVWRSPDRGQFGNWEDIGSVGGENQVLAASSILPNLLYLGSGGSVYRFDPDFETWESVSGNLPGSYVTRIVTDPFTPNGVYVTLSGFGSSHIFKSAQGGVVWQDITGNLPHVPFQDLVVDQTEPGTLYAGGDLGVYRSLDGGVLWEVFGEGIPVVRVDDMEMQTVTGKLRVATHGRGMWEIATGSSDLALLYPNGGEILSIGSELEFRWAGLTHAGNVSIDINRSYPSGTWETILPAMPNDGLEPWTVTGPAADNVRFRILHESIAGQSDTTDAETRFAEPLLDLLYPNGGATVLSGSPDTVRFARVLVDEPVMIELNRNYPTGEWGLLQGEVSGDEFRWIVQLPGSEHCRVRITSTIRPELTDMSEADFTLRAPVMTILAPNGGEQLSTGTPFDIHWDAPEHEARVRISLNRSYPDGAWEIINPNAANNGVFSWTTTGPATSTARVRVAAQFDPLQTFTESAANFSILDLDAEEHTVPSEFRIGDAYPNPFNPATQVALELPTRTRVDARVFNHLGQQVALLVDEEMDAGVHRIAFDGSGLSSGTYFIHISTYGETKILKAVLLK
jgi:photosystem II stability/assembly factor-like uncharacterized protein